MGCQFCSQALLSGVHTTNDNSEKHVEAPALMVEEVDSQLLAVGELVKHDTHCSDPTGTAQGEG